MVKSSTSRIDVPADSHRTLPKSGPADQREEIQPQRESFLLRSARFYLLCHICASFAGAFNFFAFEFNHLLGFSPFDALALGSLALVLALDRGGWDREKAILPYSFLILFYYSVGLLSLDGAEPLSVAGSLRRLVFLSLLIWEIPAALADRFTLRRFALLVQCAAVASLLISALELLKPDLVSFLVRETPDAIFATVQGQDVQRACGLLRNPNDMAMFLVFALLIARWSPVWAAAAGCAAEIIGVCLTTSRSGAALLALCILTTCAPSLRDWTRRWGAIGFFVISVAMTGLGATGWYILSRLGPGSGEAAQDMSLRLARMVDVKSELYTGERINLLEYWVPRALGAPFFGEGILSYQGQGPTEVLGTHNTWVMLLGEVGVLGPLLLLGVIVLGVARTFRGDFRRGEAGVLLLLSAAWMVATLKAHVLFGFRHYVITMALIQFLPKLLDSRTKSGLGARLSHRVRTR